MDGKVSATDGRLWYQAGKLGRKRGRIRESKAAEPHGKQTFCLHTS